MALDLNRQEAEELKRNCDFASYKTHEVRHDVAAMESLIAKGYLQKDGISVVLTPPGKPLIIEGATRLAFASTGVHRSFAL